MTKVDQDIYINDPQGRRGNCLQAAVASLLDLKLEEVPHFISHDRWFQVFYDFLKSQGVESFGNPSKEQVFSHPRKYGTIGGHRIGVGISPRGVYHAVIYKGKKMVHDPHYSRDGVELEYFYDLRRKVLFGSLVAED